MTLSIIIPSRAENGPLDSVVKHLPDANIVRFDATGMSPAVAVSQAMTFYSSVFTYTKTKRVLCLGDRYETMAAALTALFLRIPVAHCHGGESTEGAFDDPLRHSITHIADTHFVAHELFSKRVFAMRSSSAGIHVVGAPGLDGIQQGSATRSDRTIIAAYYPETMAPDHGIGACKEMLKVLSEMSAWRVKFIPTNNDPESGTLTTLIGNAIRSNPSWTWWSGTRAEYVEAIKTAALCIGNSSSFVIESPWIGCPSVIVGNRQKGRPLAPSVFQWNRGGEVGLPGVIEKAIGFNGHSNPFYCGGPVGERIATILKGIME